MKALVCAAALGFAVFGLCPDARGQEKDDATRAAARGLGISGVENYQAGRYEQATDELEKAYGILRAPSLALWSARALVKRGLLVEAARRYLEATGLQAPIGDATVQKQAIADARAELAELEPRIPSLSIRLVGAASAEVAVTIDGKAVESSLLDSPRLVNPGAHEVIATRGSERVSARATVSEGQQRDVTLQFRADGEAAPPPAAKPNAPSSGSAPHGDAAAPRPDGGGTGSRRSISIVALAAGGAGLVLGGVAGGLAYSKKSELDATGKCTDGCPSSLAGDVDQLHLYRTLSTAGFIAGGVLTGLGVVLWVTAPASHGREARALLTPNGVVVTGRF